MAILGRRNKYQNNDGSTIAEISLEKTLNAIILKMANNGEWEDGPGGKLIPAMKIVKNIS